MKFTVERSKWLRGRGNKASFLLDTSNIRCCIGFVGQQCGISDEALLNRRAIQSPMAFSTDSSKMLFEMENWPLWMRGHTQDITNAYGTNDDMNISDEVREEELKKLFSSHGDEIEFV